MRILKPLTALVLWVFLGAATSATAQTWAEVDDAGELPEGAQVAEGSGALTTINGSLSFGDVDMYQIYITGGGTFAALAQGMSPLYLDAELFLFDEQGRGIYANDNRWPPDPFFAPGAALLPSGHALTPTASGRYFLAISTRYREPNSDAGAIFPCVGCSPSTVFGPTGLGGADPITSWSGSPFGAGSYTITLTGAQFVTPTGTPLSLMESLRTMTTITSFGGQNGSKDQQGLIGKVDNAIKAWNAQNPCAAAQKLLDYKAKVQQLASTEKLETTAAASLLAGVNVALDAVLLSAEQNGLACGIS